MNIKCEWISVALVTLFIRCFVPLSASIVKSSLRCHGDMVLLDCPPSEVIDVLWANYGRTNGNICGRNVPVTNCYATNTTQMVQHRCNHKSTCAVEASHLIFGDPCVGIFKYLDVRYQCTLPSQQQHSIIICENEVDEIQCNNGKRLQITSANYGRTNKNICSSSNNQNIKCSSPKSLEVLKKQCDFKESCTIESNNGIFGNPCADISKYLTVTYTCTSITVQKENTALECTEGATLNLGCNGDETIEIMWANYGRTDDTVCTSSPGTTNCYAPNSTEIVGHRCNHKYSCSMESSYLKFGDPCIGKNKYLDIRYVCRKPSEWCENPNEEYSNCYQCDPTCDHPLYRICFIYAKKSGCVCKNGYVRDENGSCILAEDCPKHR